MSPGLDSYGKNIMHVNKYDYAKKHGMNPTKCQA